MKTVKLTAYVHVDKYNDGKYFAHSADMTNWGDVCLGKAEFEFTIPEDFNPVAAEVAMLEKKLGAMAAEYHTNAAKIKSRISDLQCLPAPEVTA